MISFLNDTINLKNKTCSFNDNTSNNLIDYTYYFFNNPKPTELITKYKGNILDWFETTHNKHILKNSDDPTIYETCNNSTCFLNYFSLESEKNLLYFEYEYLISNKLNHFNSSILQFPKTLSFYNSEQINHVGYIQKPILLNDFKYNTSNILPLEYIFLQKSIDISEVINVILQICCGLELAQNKFNFCHYNCKIDSFFIYNISKHKNRRTKKFFKFDIPNYGTIFIPGNYVCLFSNFKNSRININNFDDSIRNNIIDYWINNEDKEKPMMKNHRFFDVYTLINNIFSKLANKKNIIGNIDKKTIFTIISKKMIKEWNFYKTNNDINELSIKHPLDLIKTFHEMGLASLRLPSNKTVSIYNYGNNGKDKRTYLTYNKTSDKTVKKTIKNINIEDCSWNEIRSIAKEFGLKSKGKGINKAFLKKKIKDELPFY